MPRVYRLNFEEEIFGEMPTETNGYIKDSPAAPLFSGRLIFTVVAVCIALPRIHRR